jgi:hypothetical protein
MELVLQIIMIGGAGIVGYGIRAIKHPVQKRGPNGRFMKKG